MANQVVPLGWDSLARGPSVEPSTHFPDHSVEYHKGTTHHWLRVEPAICQLNQKIGVPLHNG